MKTWVLLFFTVVSVVPLRPPEKIAKESIRSQGKERTYYLFVADNIKSTTTVPLIVLLHGTGRNGLSLIEKWKDLAKKEGFIIVGPDASTSNGWKIPEDGPDFIYELVEALAAKYPINKRRVYLFGHSAGAGQALYLSLLESEYFAATAVHAGALAPEDGPYLDRARRKIPIAIFVGTNDNFFPLPVVRATRDALTARGFKVELTEMKDHTHWYYDRAPEINRSAWDFLKGHELNEDPRYQQHRFGG
ncbi:MAG TPA: PHB depolymerase family esterase [Pyrinomonadaceae bacterium]